MRMVDSNPMGLRLVGGGKRSPMEDGQLELCKITPHSSATNNLMMTVSNYLLCIQNGDFSALTLLSSILDL